MAAPKGYDFAGWATKNDIKCSDGRIIRSGAFVAQDGQKVPLVWNHKHDSVSNVLGHTILENRKDGVYAYGFFNDTEAGRNAKTIAKHGDIAALSIWANELEQDRSNVTHGVIREVSLVLAGANKGAMIESVLAHGYSIDIDEEEGILYTGEPVVLAHAESGDKGSEKEEPPSDEGDRETVGDIYNTLNQKQKEAVAIIVGQAIADAKGDSENNDEGDDDMKHNVFESGGIEDDVIVHADFKDVLAEAKRCGSLKEAYEAIANDGTHLAHALDATGMTMATGSSDYGFNDPEMLFPEYRTFSATPEWLSRNMDWVNGVMSGVHKTPFSRIKSVYADITEDEARAKGYIKGNEKKTEVFTLLKRTTDPQTVYKLQKMDRDDVIDITDFDVVNWIRSEMRMMLNEEIARAILIGDGRQADAEDKIKEQHIRPIVTDVPLYNVKVDVPAGASETIDEILRARKRYKGSGNPTLFTTEDELTEMLLLKDKVDHRLYKTEAELATALRVRNIVTVEAMEGAKVDGKNLVGVIVNLNDYNVGTDRGGAVATFDDFDIKFNQYLYLIEARLSGALVKPYSALTILRSGSTGASERMAARRAEM